MDALSTNPTPSSSPAPGAPRRKVPAAAVFLACLASGALGAIALRAFAPSLFTGSGDAEAIGWTDELGRFQKAVPRSRGRLELAESRHDFGEVLDGAHASKRFEFRNTGSEPLQILEIVKPCTCIAIDGLGVFDQRGAAVPVDSSRERDLLTLLPDQRGYIDVRTFPIGSTSARETRRSTLQFVTNGSGHERVYLELESTFLYVVGVEVRRAGESEFRASRNREVELGTLGRDERASFWIDIVDLEQGRFDLTGEIQVDGRPWKEGPPYFALTVEDTERLGRVMKRLVLDIGAGKPMGRLQHELLVPTSIHGGHALRLGVRGLVGSDLYLETLSGGREALPRASFGILRPNEGTTIRRTLRYVGGRTDFALRGAAIRRSEGAAAPELKARLAPAGERAWTLELELPRGAESSFLLDLDLSCEPADALPVHELSLQVQGIVPAGRAAAAKPPREGLAAPRLAIERASEDLGTLVHGSIPEVAFLARNPGEADLALRAVRQEQGPPLRFVRAELEDGSPAPTPTPTAGAALPERPAVAVIPARGARRLVFALDTTPLVRGTTRVLSGVEIESDDPVTPRVRLTVRAAVDYPAGLFGPSAEAPGLVLPLREIWIPPVGRTGVRTHEVELRPTRAWDGSYATRVTPAAAGAPWPNFLEVTTEERRAVDDSRYVALRFTARGEKSPSAYALRVRIETEIAGGYAFETDVRGEVLEDVVLVREEALRDRSGPGGELLFGEFLRPIEELALGPARAGAELVRQERLRYLGAREDFAFDPRPRVVWNDPTETAPPPALEVEILAPEPPAHPDARLALRLPRGAARDACGEIELREAGREHVTARIPFVIRTNSGSR